MFLRTVMTADLHDPSRVMLVIFGRRTADHALRGISRYMIYMICQTSTDTSVNYKLQYAFFSGKEFPGRDWLFLEIIRKEPITGALTKCEAFLGVQKVLHWSVKYVPAYPPRKVCQDLALVLLRISRKVNICSSQFFLLHCTTWPKWLGEKWTPQKQQLSLQFFAPKKIVKFDLIFINVFHINERKIASDKWTRQEVGLNRFWFTMGFQKCKLLQIFRHFQLKFFEF